MLRPISIVNSTEIRLFINNDEVTLEYEDSVILMFTSPIPDLVAGLEKAGEYLRSGAIVNIMDNDS